MTVLSVTDLCIGPIQGLNAQWSSGVHWVCGDESTGKTTLLRVLAGVLTPDAGRVWVADGGVVWLDWLGVEHQDTTPREAWSVLAALWPQWDHELHSDLSAALRLDAHIDKPLYMLSAGTRRKAMWVGVLAAGARVSLLDQPFAALDGPSVAVIRAFLREAAPHTERTWIVADHQAPTDCPPDHILHLGA